LSTYTLVVCCAGIAIITPGFGRGVNASLARDATAGGTGITIIAVDGYTNACTRLTNVVRGAGISITTRCYILIVDASQAGITRIICAWIAVVAVDQLSGSAGAIKASA